MVETLAELDKAMADLRFDAAANAIYHFVWDTFCDWYIELIKGSFDAETKTVAGWVLDQILVMLHPFMPFVTEELWSKMGERADYPLITAKWPEPGARVDEMAKREVEWLIALVGNIRGLRAEFNVPPSAVVPLLELGSGISPSGRLQQFSQQVSRLGRVVISGLMTEGVDQSRVDRGVVQGQGVQFGVDNQEYSLFLLGYIDIEAEKARLAKSLEAAQKEARSLEGRLGNPAFVEKAKPEAVEKARADHAHHTAEAERLAAALARLG